MPSTYTVNLGIEKPATGEQSGTWGDTTNTNFDLIDQAVNGIVQLTLTAAGSSGSPTTLTITNGAASDGRNKYVEFVDSGDLGATAYVQLDPNNAKKIVHMRNSLSGGRSVIVFQGTYNASNDFEIPNGKDVVLKFDGAGSGATVTQVFVDLKLDALDATTVAATTGNVTTVNATTVAATTGNVTTVNATTVNATTVDTTNVEFTNIKAKDGTTAGSIADSTGVVTLASSVLTTTDINGGTIDGVTIGGASAGAGTFSSLTTTTADINGGTIDGVTIGGASAGAGTFTTITGSGDLAVDTDTLFVDVSEDAVGINNNAPARALHVNDTMRLEPRATAPASPSAGDVFFNSTSTNLEFYDGTAWVNAGAGVNTIITTVTTTSTSKTLGTGERCHVDTAGQTITLPATPLSGDIVGVVVGDFDDTVVARNGSTIMGAAEDFTIDSAYASVDFQYIGSTWRLV